MILLCLKVEEESTAPDPVFYSPEIKLRKAGHQKIWTSLTNALPSGVKKI